MRKLKGHWITVFKYLMSGYMEDKNRLFSVAKGVRTRSGVLNYERWNLDWISGSVFSL